MKANEALAELARAGAEHHRLLVRNVGIHVSMRDDVLPLAREIRREWYGQTGRFVNAISRRWLTFRQQAMIEVVMRHSEEVARDG